MKKFISTFSFLSLLLVPASAFCMEVSVEITGPQELSSLKSGIEKSVVTRCITRGIALEKYGKLTINISKLGEITSYDALLDTKPAKAFHKDIKDTSALSATMDEMINALFIESGKTQAAPVQPAAPPLGQEVAPKIRLPFIAVSIASTGDKIFVSDEKTVYELKGEKASPLWKAPGKNEILRIYPFGDSLIVLAKIINECRSFRIKGSETKERWDKAVFPLGKGLVSTDITFDKIYGTIPYVWSKPSQITGSSPRIPHGFDTISAVTADMKISAGGEAVISYNLEDKLSISDGKSVLWTDDTLAGHTTLFIEDEYKDRREESEPPARYYLEPRISVLGDKIITYRNGQGMAKVVSGLNLFDFSQVLVYTPAGSEYTQNELATFPESYCPDAILFQGKVAALIVKNKSTYIQFLGL
ncbi:MAG TPA: hypothetical protein VMU10_01200 [Desulfomonilia bacterium]|nr:hypothetical protein [Desulfomonilia bacterium]